MKIGPEIGAVFEKMIQQVKDPRFATGVHRVTITGMDDFVAEGQARGHKIVADEVVATGGTDKGPTPLEYFMAGFGFCEHAIFVRHASRQGLTITNFELSVKGMHDRRGVYGTADVSPAFFEIDTEMKIESPNTEQEIRKAVDTMRRHCPAYNTLKGSAKIVEKVYHNGKEIS